MRTLTAVICTFLSLLLTLVSARADIIYVGPGGDYETIQEAVDAAHYGDEIIVAEGIYQDPTHMAFPPLDSTLCVVVMKPGLTLTGSGIGVTIIDGDSLGRGINLRDDEGIEIRNLTIRCCYAEEHGAGIFCKRSSPYIHNVELAGNYDGGIALADSSSPIIEFCSMIDNEAKAGGGLDIGLMCEPWVSYCDITNNRAPFAAGVQVRGSATFTHCIIDGNHTTEAVNVLGGGVFVTDVADPLFRYCQITNNSCSGEGGGICFMDSKGRMRRCEISGNVSTGLEARGGGIYIGSLSDVEIVACVVAGNYTTGLFSDGGGLWDDFSDLTMENCTFYANWTEGEGHPDSLAGNIGLGTSIYIPAIMQISHCIVSDSPRGRGLYIVSNGGDPPQISCCDFFGNAGADTICGTGNGNFCLDPLMCDPGEGNYRLQADSPCRAGHHPEGPEACGGLLIGAYGSGCGTGVDDPISEGAVALLGNQPNPFARSTIISFRLRDPGRVRLEIIDLSGRRIRLLQEAMLPAGVHQVTWDGTTGGGERAASGVYFYRLRAGDLIQGRRMLHLR